MTAAVVVVVALSAGVSAARHYRLCSLEIQYETGSRTYR